MFDLIFTIFTIIHFFIILPFHILCTIICYFSFYNRVCRHPGPGQPVSGRTRRDSKRRQEGQQEHFSPLEAGCKFSPRKSSSKI